MKNYFPASAAYLNFWLVNKERVQIDKFGIKF